MTTLHEEQYSSSSSGKEVSPLLAKQSHSKSDATRKTQNVETDETHSEPEFSEFDSYQVYKNDYYLHKLLLHFHYRCMIEYHSYFSDPFFFFCLYKYSSSFLMTYECILLPKNYKF